MSGIILVDANGQLALFASEPLPAPTSDQPLPPPPARARLRRKAAAPLPPDAPEVPVGVVNDHVDRSTSPAQGRSGPAAVGKAVPCNVDPDQDAQGPSSPDSGEASGAASAEGTREGASGDAVGRYPAVMLAALAIPDRIERARALPAVDHGNPLGHGPHSTVGVLAEPDAPPAPAPAPRRTTAPESTIARGDDRRHGVLEAIRVNLGPVERVLLTKDGTWGDPLPTVCREGGLIRPGRRNEPIERGLECVLGTGSDRGCAGRALSPVHCQLITTIWDELPVDPPADSVLPPDSWCDATTHGHLPRRWCALAQYDHLARAILPSAPDTAPWWLGLATRDSRGPAGRGASSREARIAVPVTLLTVGDQNVGLCYWTAFSELPRILLIAQGCAWRSAVVRLNWAAPGPVVRLADQHEFRAWVSAPRPLRALWSPWTPLRDAVVRREVRRWDDVAVLARQPRDLSLDDALSGRWVLGAPAGLSDRAWQNGSLQDGDVDGWLRRIDRACRRGD